MLMFLLKLELPHGRMIGIREQRVSTTQTMARSLPVSVPLPEGLPKRASIFDLPSDEGDEEESDGEKENGNIVHCCLMGVPPYRSSLKIPQCLICQWLSRNLRINCY